MATLPSARTSVQDTAGAVASGVDLVAVVAPVATNADAVPRLYGNAAAIFTDHGYSEGLEYCALHFALTRKAVLFVGVPIATPGAVGREDTSGNTGTATTTVSAGSAGVLSEHDGVLTVIRGGVVGTDQITLGLSLDGGRFTRRVRLGTATSYTIPYVGVTVSFGVGTLVEGDTIHTWHGTGPRADADGIAAAKDALAAQMKGFRSILLIGDLQNSTEAAAYLAQLNAYATENERFVYGRASVRDRAPQAALSSTTWRMTGSPSLTFDSATDTITRAAGSWLADGFAVGDTITVDGTVNNNGDFVITALNATVAEVHDLVDEVAANATVTGRATVTFADSGDTLTRNRGSWLADGFRAGDTVTIAGTSGGTNDGDADIATLTPLVMTLAAGGVSADETIAAGDVTVSTGQSKAQWMADVDAEFAAIDDAPRIDLSAGRARRPSPFSGWWFRRPASWAASLIEYQHDLHVATWRKADGVTGWTLDDADGQLAEWDDRVDGGAGSAARFTTFRTYSNGPQGAFITLSLTRAVEGSVLSLTHNAAVVNLACTIVQAATENVIGRSLELNDDGTATSDSLSTIQREVNAALEIALLQNRGEGKRASKAVWTPSADDVLNVAEPLLTGVLDLNLNGTIHSVATTVRVRSGGQ